MCVQEWCWPVYTFKNCRKLLANTSLFLRGGGGYTQADSDYKDELDKTLKL